MVKQRQTKRRGEKVRERGQPEHIFITKEREKGGGGGGGGEGEQR